MAKLISIMKAETEEFYRNAFCAKTAETLLSPAQQIKEQFTIDGVVKIDSGDARGVFYVARVTPNKLENNET